MIFIQIYLQYLRPWKVAYCNLRNYFEKLSWRNKIPWRYSCSNAIYLQVRYIHCMAIVEGYKITVFFVLIMKCRTDSCICGIPQWWLIGHVVNQCIPPDIFPRGSLSLFCRVGAITYAFIFSRKSLRAFWVFVEKI